MAQQVLPWSEGQRARQPARLAEDRDIPSSVSGTVFYDANGNAVRAPGEARLSERTVFLNTNRNGVLDPGETIVLTDANGASTLT